MPWTSTKDGLRTRYQLSGGWGIGSLLAAPLILAFFGVFGPGFLGVGSMILTVTCERVGEGPAADCSVTEGYLFGLVPLRHSVQGATGVGSATTRATKGTVSSRLVFETPGEQVPLLTTWSNMNDGEKRETRRAVEGFFAGTERRLALRVGFYNVFALFGGPLTLLWLLIVWAYVTAPLGFIWRAGFEVDPMARVLRVRAKPGPRPMREIALGDLAAIEASHNPGGWLGSLVEKSGAKPPRRGRTPELHLRLVLRGGERVVVRNLHKLPDEQLHALRRHLAEATGVATS